MPIIGLKAQVKEGTIKVTSNNDKVTPMKKMIFFLNEKRSC